VGYPIPASLINNLPKENKKTKEKKKKKGLGE
jgi:hypothetical protein